MNVPETRRTRGRVKLALVAAVFLVPVIVAAALTLFGWHPGTRGHGEPIMPQRSFAKIDIRLADGSRYAWRDSEPRMTLVALPGPHCQDECLHTLALLRNARITLNRNSDRLRLLFLGKPPAGAAGTALRSDWTVGTDVAGKLDAFRPMTSDSVAAILVESNGTALSYYRAGFDPRGLSKDLQKVIR